MREGSVEEPLASLAIIAGASADIFIGLAILLSTDHQHAALLI